MESTPTGVSVTKLHEELKGMPGVIEVHNLHTWDLRPGKTVLIAHIVSEKGQERKVLRRVTDYCRKKKIYHSTIQVEEIELKDHDSYILCDHDLI